MNNFLRCLLLRKKIDAKKNELATLREKDAEFEARQTNLAAAIEGVDENTSAEDRSSVEEEVAAFDAEYTAHRDAVAAAEAEIASMENELAEEESHQDTTPPANIDPAPAQEERKDGSTMNISTRNRIFKNMSSQERSAFVARKDVKDYLGEIRSAIKEQRAITNVGLTIPQVMLPLLRENILNYSKLYRHVTVRPVSGDAVMPIMGETPEGIWTDCCANLNEMTLAFYDMEVGCFKVSGYFAVCNANIEDSDLDLIAELLDALGQALGKALDKAILFGRNSAQALKMPQGVVSRLVQTEAPAGYPATARPWADLHTTNITTIAASVTGVELFQKIALASGAAKGKYARGEKVWVMNETTYTAIVSAAMTIDAGGAIVAGVNGRMPVIGGIIEVLDFIPNNVIIGGYFELYILAERRGPRFATSEHVRFLQDQTVLKGTARYDGGPAIAEAFVAIGIAGVTPAATGVTFPQDTANS